MTDLERAKEIERQLRVWDADHTPDRWITLLMIHLAAARREGAEEMRERAAELAEARLLLGLNIRASDIRALPLTPEEPT